MRRRRPRKRREELPASEKNAFEKGVMVDQARLLELKKERKITGQVEKETLGQFVRGKIRMRASAFHKRQRSKERSWLGQKTRKLKREPAKRRTPAFAGGDRSQTEAELLKRKVLGGGVRETRDRRLLGKEEVG